MQVQFHNAVLANLNCKSRASGVKTGKSHLQSWRCRYSMESHHKSMGKTIPNSWTNPRLSTQLLTTWIMQACTMSAMEPKLRDLLQYTIAVFINDSSYALATYKGCIDKKKHQQINHLWTMSTLNLHSIVLICTISLLPHNWISSHKFRNCFRTWSLWQLILQQNVSSCGLNLVTKFLCCFFHLPWIRQYFSH